MTTPTDLPPQPEDETFDWVVLLPEVVDRCLAHMEDEPCGTCRAYIAMGF